MVLAFAFTDVNTILTCLALLLTIITSVIAIIYKIKAGNWQGVAEETGKLANECAKTIDTIKGKTDGTPARAVVTDALKIQGAELEKVGLKSAMDAKLLELGLNAKS
jgi:hypothetical protein